MKLRYTLIIGAAMIAAPAMAQDAPAAQTAPAQTAPAPAATPAASASGTAGAGLAETAAPTAVTDAEITQFATAALAVNKIQADTSVAEADRQPKLVAAITAAGLTAERFNAISQAMQADPALNKKIQAAAATAQGSTAPAAGATATPR